MEKHFVNSSIISSIGYDASSSILEVEFKNGVAWHYSDFPEYLWYEFKSAESYGKFFHSHIREQYTSSGYRVR